jgi:hypothetical protein
MPYIKKDRRDDLIEQIDDEKNGITRVAWIDCFESAGELQYIIAEMLKSYIKRKGLNYQHCNDVMGALAGAQMEFYRQVVSKYEDEKIKENGAV